MNKFYYINGLDIETKGETILSIYDTGETADNEKLVLRIAACLNACEGINTYDLENYPLICVKHSS